MLTQQKLIGVGLLQKWSDNMCKSYQTRIEKVLLDLNYKTDFLSLDTETKIKEFVKLQNDEKKLLLKLLNDSNGIRWQRPIPGCPSQKLIDLGLARWDSGKGENLLKATKFSFYPEIQYLVGLINSY